MEHALAFSVCDRRALGFSRLAHRVAVERDDRREALQVARGFAFAQLITEEQPERAAFLVSVLSRLSL